MEIIRNEFWKDFVLTQVFEKNYSMIGGENILVYSVLGKLEEDKLEEVAIIFLRCFIQKGEELLNGQKYVIGMRFVDFGGMAVVDLISIEGKSHRDIAYEHTKNMQWLLDSTTEPHDRFMATYNVPVIYTGGYVKAATDGRLRFFGSSGDYTNKIFGEDVNDIARFISFACNIAAISETKQSATFFDNLLGLMLRNKNHKCFYESIVESYIYTRLTAQQIGALITMKSLDRALAEGKSVIEMLVDEVTNPAGLAKFILIATAARKPKDG